MLSSTNNYIQTLVSTGNDAHAHLYEVTFDGGYFTNIATALSIRCEGFSQPPQSQETYPVRYITAYIDRPKTKITLTRNFKLKFRLDDNYTVYKALLAQRKLTSNPANSFATGNILTLKENGLLFNVKVNIIKELNDTLSDSEDLKINGQSYKPEVHEALRLFNFYDCWVHDVSPLTFSDSGDPLTAEITINFLTMEDWQSGLTGDPEHGQKINL